MCICVELLSSDLGDVPSALRQFETRAPILLQY